MTSIQFSLSHDKVKNCLKGKYTGLEKQKVKKGSSCGIMTKVLNCSLEVSEFKLKWNCYNHFLN